MAEVAALRPVLAPTSMEVPPPQAEQKGDRSRQEKGLEAFFQAALVPQSSSTTVVDVMKEILGDANIERLSLPHGLRTIFTEAQVVSADSTVSYEEVGFALVVRSAHLPFGAPPPSTNGKTAATTKTTTMLSLEGDAFPLARGLLQLDWLGDAKGVLTVKTELDLGTEETPLKLSVLRKGESSSSSGPLLRVSEQPVSWLNRLKEKSDAVGNADSLVAALAPFGDMLVMSAEFDEPAKATVTMLDEALEALRVPEKAKSDAVALLQKEYWELKEIFQHALSGAKETVHAATTQLRQRLNLSSATVPLAKFSPRDGVVLVDWDSAWPRQYLSKAEPSKLAWEIVVGTPAQAAPGDDIAATPGIIIETRSGATTSAELRREELKGMKEVRVWVRARYTDLMVLGGEQSIVSAVWAVADVITVDEALAARFSSSFTLTGKPTVDWSEAFVRADWTSVIPKTYKETEFRRLGDVQWEVVMSPTSNPADAGAIREILPISSTRTEKDCSRMTTVFVLVRAVVDVGMIGFTRFESPWAIGDATRRPASSTLGSGESLAQNEYLVSYFEGNRSEESRLVLQGDGNFVLYHQSSGGQSSRAVWASGSNFQTVKATMQADGNLVLFDGSGASSWDSDTNNPKNEGASLILQDDGNAVIRTKNGEIAWTTRTKRLKPISQKDRLQVGEMLLPGQALMSPNGRYQLALQDDGNFVLYDGSKATWAIGTTLAVSAVRVEMGDDDNLVVLRGTETWATNTQRRAGDGRGALIMRDDGIAVVVSDGTIIWATNSKFVQAYEPLDLVAVKQRSDRLRPGEFLGKGQSLTSANGQYAATLQNDGNFTLYRTESSSETLWASKTSASTITRLCFGLYPRELILYEQGAKSRWTPERREYDKNAVLLLGDDGNLSVVSEKADPYKYGDDDGNTRWWSTGTIFPASRGRVAFLRRGESLTVDQRLVSTNGTFEFSFTSIGDLRITSNTTTIFSRRAYNPSNSADSPRRLTHTPDGHLELRDRDGASVWKERPNGQGATHFVLTDTGSAYLTNSSSSPSEIIWAILPQSLGARLQTASSLYPNQRLTSPNGTYSFVLQDDGNLVLYKVVPSPPRALWASASYGREPGRLTLQEDGNLVLYERGSPSPRGPWATATNIEGEGKRERVLEVRDDGDVVLSDQGRKVWSTETAGM
ncbi:MAG: hypothetical protein M1837_005640 [Sclerophora amabilis]|nr:MAG: hypothetical protein M1837_005640 [Sclerophora amabilis]